MRNKLRYLSGFSIIAISLTGCGGGGSNSNSPVNAAPVATGISILDNNAGSIVLGDILTGQYTYQDAEGDTEGASEIRWLRNGAAITGATSSNYSVVPADAGMDISFEITPVATTGTTTGSAANSAVSVPFRAPAVTASPGDSEVSLSWSTEATDYKVEFHDGSGTWATATTTTATQFTHTGLTNGLTYTYRVNGSNSSVTGPSSTEVSATPAVPPTTAPATVSAVINHVAVNDNPLTLSWPAVAGATKYRVYYDTVASVDTNDSYIDSTTTNLAVNAIANVGINDGETYYFRVLPMNDEVSGTTISGEIAVTATYSGWTYHSASSGARIIRGTAHDAINGVTIRVGDSGMVSRSTDGINWAIQYTGTTYDLTAVVWTGTRFVAVANSDASYYVGSTGLILTSNDGITWTHTSGAISGGAQDIAWSGTQLLVVGYNGVAMISDDEGDSWSPISGLPANLYDDFTSVIWDGTQFIVSNPFGYHYTVNITTMSLTGISTNAGNLSWSGTTYAAVYATWAYTSSDLVTWSADTFTDTTNLQDIVWDTTNNQFVAVGMGGVIYTTPDGSTWTRQTSGVSHDLYNVTSINGSLVASGDKGTVLTSTDGIAWSNGEASNNQTIRAIISNGGDGWMAVGDAGTIATSPDGNTWSWQTQTFSGWASVDLWRSVSYNGSRYVVIGNVGAIISSDDDGVTWTERTSGTVNNLVQVLWDGVQFVAIGATGTVLTSSDGVTWTPQTSGTVENLVQLRYDNGLYIAAGNNGAIITSNDSVTWTVQNSSTTQHLRSLTYHNGLYIAGGGNSTMLTSNDAISWSVTTVAGTGTVRGLGWDGNKFIMSDNFGGLYHSTDGISWTKEAKQPLGIIFDFILNSSGRMMAAGVGGMIMSKNP
ncbi:MAG: hypothetical protein OEZ16_02255 [Chromatiales bacterium]|nr:hypothetical protein [Chromatiales bacterium]